MDLHWQPVGPLPAETYWRRRFVVGMLVIAVVSIVALTLPFGGGQDPAGAAAGRTSAPTADPTTGSDPSTSATTSPPDLCPDDALEVEAASDNADYPVGARVALTLTVTNTGTVACRRALGQGAVELVVTSGEDRIWSSDDCAAGGPEGERLLEPGAVQTARASWDTTRSLPGCPPDQPTAQPGTYRVTARVGELRVPGAVFRLGP